ncbi:MAG: bifunctional riboflavin kinase/FAD synthetase [Deltaproteobacteria bacterium]|nr:bifunctional riboflavin kinase/FAD synthetase [Deltaproteobacteria bacterium]
MRVVRGSAELGAPLTRCVLTAGNFDGVHVGHQRIMATVTSRAKALGGTSLVYTFDPHPRRVLTPERAPKLLTTLEQKLELLESLGVDAVVVEPFDLEFAKQGAERFVREVLHARLRPVEVYVGYDFHYGRDREGSMRTLTELGPHLGFAVTIIPEVKLGERDVNSTRVRELLAEGDVGAAAELLGRSYRVRGRVKKGDQRGRTIGFPTLNLAAENEILPGVGVYACRVRFLEGDTAKWYGAVANVGRRPTVKEDDPVAVEAHLFDFASDAYERRIEVAFEHWLRGEQRFASLAALQEQIARDSAAARARLAAG